MIYQSDTLVIGAGLSGLHFASLAKKAGKDVLIIEKSKGLGGRLATRRINDLSIDHGLQWFSELAEISTHFNKWNLQESSQGYYSSQGMTFVAKQMAADLAVHKGQRANKITQGPNWIVETEEGSRFEAKSIVLTAPLPQAMELLEGNLLLPFSISNIISGYTYHKTLIGIFIFEAIPKDLNSFEEDGNKVIVMREKSLHPNAVLLALNSELSEKHYSNSDQECLNLIHKKWNQLVNTELKINHLELKRWRYSTPKQSLPFPYIEVQKNLYLIGDGFLIPDSRGAILSAEALAHYLYKI